MSQELQCSSPGCPETILYEGPEKTIAAARRHLPTEVISVYLRCANGHVARYTIEGHPKHTPQNWQTDEFE